MTSTVFSSVLADSVAAHQSGDLVTAASGYATVLGSDPNNPQAWHLSGVIALQAGQPHDAIANIRRAIELDSSQAEFHANLAACYSKVGAMWEADRAAARSIELDPDLPVAYFRRGKVLTNLGHVDEAMTHFQRALDLEYEPAATLLEAAIAYRSIGAIDKCIEALQQSELLAQDPVPALCQLASLAAEGAYELNAAQFRRLAGAIESVGASEQSRKTAARAAFALGAVLEHASEYEQAFELYTAGNQLTRQYLSARFASNWLHDRRTYLQRVRHKFTRDVVHAGAQQGSSSTRPIFVVGCPRSGTSLVTQILAAHSRVGSVGELRAMSLLCNRATNLWSDDQDLPIVEAGQIQRIADGYLNELSTHDVDSQFVVDKMPGNALVLGFVHMVFPQSPLIWCVREPRDVAISAFSIMFQEARLQYESSDLGWLAATIGLSYEMLKYWLEVIPRQSIHVVDYDTLTSNPEREISSLLQACSLEWEPQCLSPEAQSTAVRTASSLQVRRPIHARSQQRWKRFEHAMVGLEWPLL